MIESLFGCNTANSVPKEGTRKSVLPPVERENRVLDPKKSQNIAILLRALNVTREEVSEALLDGMYPSLACIEIHVEFQKILNISEIKRKLGF